MSFKRLMGSVILGMLTKVDVRRRLIAALIVTAVIHTIYNALLPLHPDEAYYWLWSRHLDLSYYDHPPMIAWLIYIFSLGFTEEFAVRFTTVLCMSVAGYAACMTAYRAALSIKIRRSHTKKNSGMYGLTVSALVGIFNPLVGMSMAGNTINSLEKESYANKEKTAEKALWITFIAFSIVPMTMMGYVFVTPDSPLIMFWCLAMYWGLKAILDDGDFYYLLTGLAIALMILSKYTAVLFILSLFIFIILYKRDLLLNKYLWFAGFIALLGIIPIAVWNYQHDWISITFQYNHGTSNSYKILWDEFIILFLGIQLLPTPVYAVIIYEAAFFYKSLKRQLAYRYLNCLFCTPLVFFLYKGLFKKMELNWPIIAFLSAFPLMAVYLAKCGKRKLFRYGTVFAGFLTFLLVITPFLPLPDSINLSLRIKGNKEAVEILERYREELGDGQFFSNHLTNAAIMTYYLKGNPRVYIPVKSRFSQYDIWDKGTNYKLMSGYYLGHQDKADELMQVFTTVTLLEKIPTGSKQKPKYFYLYKIN